MRMNARERLRIGEQAALRMIRLEESPSKEARTEYLAWLRLSAHHVHESLFAQAVSKQLDGMDPQRAIDVDALPTLPEVTSTLLDSGVESPQAATRRRRHGSWAAALAASVALLAFAWTFFGPAWKGTRSYVTAVGEQRSIKLDDGSVMVLNTASRATVEFNGSQREIRLIEGEALFMVQRDPSRPFQVSTTMGMVVAVGTQFNVYQRGEAARISVIEGAVRITTARANHSILSNVPVDTANGSAQLNAGDEATLSPGQIVRAAKPDIPRAVAWRNRQLVFRDRGLSEVAAEFNRYNKTKITVGDETLRTRSISGVFDADDAQPLIDFLKSDPALEVMIGGNEIVIRRSGPGSANVP